MREEETVMQLRMKLLELEKLGAFNADSFNAMQGMVLQIHNEAERRKQACQQQANVLRQQLASQEAHASAYSTMSSILSAVINGYITIQRKTIAEEESRRAVDDGTAPLVSASGEVYEIADSDSQDTEKPKRRKKT